MRAIVVEKPGPPEVLILRDVPRPEPRAGWVLIRVHAFGLNRSEMYTRQGHSGDAVPFPRILGIECVGEVVAAPASDLTVGQTVAATMGGMGRVFDGSYAEYTLVPLSQVMSLQTTLPWTSLAAIPETFLTAWLSLTESMHILAGQTLLVRGGTSSVGMAAATIAKDLGLTVIATTRQAQKREALLANGADAVVIDGGQIAAEVRQLAGGGADAILELVGTTTLRDSLQAAAPQGTVCFTGILGNEWIMESFYPFADIPPTVKLTTCSTEMVTAANSAEALQRAVTLAEEGRYRLNIDRIFQLDDIVEAHHYMEAGHAHGKLVIAIN